MSSEKRQGHTPRRSSLQKGQQSSSTRANVIYFCLPPCEENAYIMEHVNPISDPASQHEEWLP